MNKWQVYLVLLGIIILCCGCVDSSRLTEDEQSETSEYEYSQVTNKESTYGMKICDILAYGEFDAKYVECAKENILLEDIEEIENIKWLDDSHSCLHVAVQYSSMPEDAYFLHKEDYFFYELNNQIVCLRVDYNMNHGFGPREVWGDPTFEARLEDVNFDQQDDLIIHLGTDGIAGKMERYCAYIKTDGKYQYCPSFEAITSYSVSRQEECIYLMRYEPDENAMVKESKYQYYNGEFIAIDIE